MQEKYHPSIAKKRRKGRINPLVANKKLLIAGFFAPKKYTFGQIPKLFL
jgi:hypothetical protein